MICLLPQFEYCILFTVCISCIMRQRYPTLSHPMLWHSQQSTFFIHEMSLSSFSIIVVILFLFRKKKIITNIICVLQLSQEVTELSEFLCCISNLFVCSVLNIFNFIFSVIHNSVLFNSFSSSASSRCVAHRVSATPNAVLFFVLYFISFFLDTLFFVTGVFVVAIVSELFAFRNMMNW